MLPPKIFIKKHLAKIRQSFDKRLIRNRMGAEYEHIHPYWRHLKIESIGNGSSRIFFNGRQAAESKPVSGLKSSLHPRVVLFGSGPSINGMDLSRVQDDEAVFVNGAIRLRERIKTKPLMNMIMDRLFVDYYPELLFRFVKPGDNLFLSFGSLDMILRKDASFLKDKNVYVCPNVMEPYMSPKRRFSDLDKTKIVVSDDESTAFSFDAEYGFYDGGTVITWAVQLAYYLNAADTFLLGVDLTSSTVSHHFYDRKKDLFFVTSAKLEKDKIINFLTLAAEIFRKNGRRISNCSDITLVPYEIIPYSEKFKTARQ
jgi:hypothetical protein